MCRCLRYLGAPAAVTVHSAGTLILHAAIEMSVAQNAETSSSQSLAKFQQCWLTDYRIRYHAYPLRRTASLCDDIAFSQNWLLRYPKTKAALPWSKDIPTPAHASPAPRPNFRYEITNLETRMHLVLFRSSYRLLHPFALSSAWSLCAESQYDKTFSVIWLPGRYRSRP